MRKTVLLLLGLGLVLALGACQKKIPLGEERADWAGYWVAADGSNLQIWPDGSGDYRSGSTRVTGAAARFEGNTLTIKMMGIGRTFTITEGPHQKGEQKVIVLDGVEYVNRRIP
jgi:hypothetical protein